MADTKIPVLKKDAVLDIKLGTDWVSKFQEGLIALAKVNEDVIKQLGDKLKDSKYKPTGIEQLFITGSLLLQEIAKKAEENGMIEYKDITI